MLKIKSISTKKNVFWNLINHFSSLIILLFFFPFLIKYLGPSNYGFFIFLGTINGDGTNSRDFTYIENVIQMNHLAATTSNPEAIGTVFNTAVGERANLLEMTNLLKEYLKEFNPKIGEVEIIHGPERLGDIPHSLASIEKARRILGYEPTHNLKAGLKEAVEWYWGYFN